MTAAGGSRMTVVGLGNPMRSDDGAGPLVASEAVRAAAGPEWELGPLPPPPRDATELIDRWDGADLAIVVDALRSGRPPGTIQVMDLGDGTQFRPEAGTSTHSLGLARALRLSRALGTAPVRVIVVGIEGVDFGPGQRLTPEVAAAVPDAVRTVLGVISEARRCA